MKSFHELWKKILDNGHLHGDRTGVGRISLYGEQLRFNMADGFPLVTTREVKFKSVFKEMLWFIHGSISNQQLNDQGVKIWDPWAVREEHVRAFIDKYKDRILELAEDEISVEDIVQSLLMVHNNDIGPIYGAGWRFAPMGQQHYLYPDIEDEDVASDKIEKYRLEFEENKYPPETWQPFLKSKVYSHVDQFQNLIVNLKKRPFSARHIVTAWIPEWAPFEQLSPQENVLLGKSALTACHCMFQCFVIPDSNKNKLSLMLTIRSSDTGVGLLFNVAQYALLLHMLAQVCDYEPYELIVNLGDTHIYANQVELIKEQITREPLPLPKLFLNPEIKDIYQFTMEDIHIEGYQYHPAMNFPIAV